MNKENKKTVYEEEYFNSFYIAFFLTIALFFFSVIWVFASFGDNVPPEKNIEYIERFIDAKQEADTSAILIGDSRIRHAARFGIEPEDIISLNNNEKMAVLQFSFDAAVYSDFASIENALLMAKPDYLFIGRPMISNYRQDNPGLILLSYRVTEYIMRLFKQEDPETIWLENRAGTETCYSGELTRRFLDLNLEAFSNRGDHSTDPEHNENIKNIRRFIRAARSTGTKVIILHLMPNMEALDKFNVPLHAMDAHGMGQLPINEELLPDQHSNVLWLDYEDKAGARHYCDFVHLNELGRPVFKDWFINTMTELRDITDTEFPPEKL